MELFGYMNNRNIDVGGIFSQEEIIKDMQGLVKQLRHTMEKQLIVWWDIANLEMYIKEKMTPRRLRWDVHPNDNIEDAALMGDWYSFFNTCENELLHNIVKRRQFKLRSIESNIFEIQKLLLHFANQQDYKDKTNELQDHIKKYDGEIQAKKQNKFKRDVLDYKSMQVYKWQVAMEDPNECFDDTLMDESTPGNSGNYWNGHP